MPVDNADPKVMKALIGVINKQRAEPGVIMLALAGLLRRAVADIYKLPKNEVEVLVVHRSGTREEVLLNTETNVRH